MATPLAQSMVQGALALLQSIAGLTNKALYVLSESELMERGRVMAYPAVGIVYEGTRSHPDSQPAHRVGLNVELGMAVVLFYRAAPSRDQDDANKTAALALLDLIRAKFLDTVGPSGKFWRFVAEAPALEKDGVVVWVQRWTLPATMVQLANPYSGTGASVVTLNPYEYLLVSSPSTGLMNGTTGSDGNAVFTMPQAPNLAYPVSAFRNGARLVRGNDFTVAGNQITFLAPNIPLPADTVVINYY